MSRSRAALPRPRRARRGPRLRTTLSALLVMGLAAFAGLFVAHRVVDPSETIATTFTRMLNPIPSPQEVFRKDRLSILLLGLDYNYNDKDEEYSGGARTDTIMALSLDLPTRALHVLSVPRDMEYTYADGHVDKINGAYTVGGPQGSERAVASFLGLPGFDRYVALRIDATKSLVDAIGGIDVPVTETLNYDDSWGHLHIHFKPGLTHMDGEQAVSYSRFRHDACSDPCRIKRQQQVLRITIAKLKGDKFNDLAHITQLIGVVNQNVRTDLSPAERLSLASAYASFNLANLASEQVPYLDDRVVANGGDVLVPDAAARERLVRRLFLDPVAPAEETADAGAVAAVDPASVRVAVENGSGVAGAGKTAADRLSAAGFAVAGVGNAATFDHDATEIHVPVGGAAVGLRVARALGQATASVLADAAADAKPAVRVVVGKDLAVATPAPSP